MINIIQDNSRASKVFEELKAYNDQYDPKVNYQPYTFVAQKDGQFIGGLEGAIAWDNFEINNIVVLDKRKGIGTKLLEHLEDFCKSKNITSITCSTMAFQAPEFYTKRGFESFAVVPNYAGEHACHYFLKRFKS
tara:strand:- start:435 stop:836 length:402 start_codon:yes stop_codon:yes gene_type:complete